jgi:hypothetical protein
VRTRRILAGLLLVGALAGGTVGCGDDGGDGDAPSTPSSSRSTTSTSNPVTPDGAQIVIPRPGMVDVRPVPFDSVAPGPDGRTLAVRFTGGVAPCFVLDRVDVAERATAVTVTLHAGREPSPEPPACIMIAAEYETVVALASPLGDRVVIDGAAS